MKRHSTSIIANAILILTKGASAIVIFDTSGVVAVLSLISILLLATSCILIWNRIKIGPLMAAAIISVYLIEFIVSGSIAKLFPYCLIHVVALLLNVHAWLTMTPEGPPGISS